MPKAVESDVVAVCEKLRSEGKAPTVEEVREAMGGGSYSTLGPLVRLWKASQAQTQSVTEPCPSQLETNGIALVKSLWGEALVSAENRYVVDREEFQKTKLRIEAETSEALEMADKHAEALDALKDYSAKREAELQEVKRQLEEARSALRDALHEAEVAQAALVECTKRADAAEVSNARILNQLRPKNELVTVTLEDLKSR